MAKRFITCAVTGAETTREKCPNLPISPAEIAGRGEAGVRRGRDGADLHVRRADGTPTQDKAIFADAIARIHEACPILV